MERNETRAVNNEDSLAEAVQSADALQSLKASSDMKVVSKTAHLMVKMHPQGEFSSFDVQLSSPLVRQELVMRNRQDNSKKIRGRMRDGMTIGIRLALFAEDFHQFMQDKSIATGKLNLRARRLTADGTGSGTTHRNSKVVLREC